MHVCLTWIFTFTTAKFWDAVHNLVSLTPKLYICKFRKIETDNDLTLPVLDECQHVSDCVTLRGENSGTELFLFVDVTTLLASEVLLLKPLTQICGYKTIPMALYDNFLHSQAFWQQMKITDEDQAIWTGFA
jgi:hypothetical protein